MGKRGTNGWPFDDAADEDALGAFLRRSGRGTGVGEELQRDSEDSDGGEEVRPEGGHGEDAGPSAQRGPLTTRPGLGDPPSCRRDVSPPFMDERAAQEVRRLIKRYTSAIPATAAETARLCNEVFGLELDPPGYGQLLTTACSPEQHDGRGVEDGNGGSGAGIGGGEVRDCYATLGLSVLEVCVARYAHGALSSPSEAAPGAAGTATAASTDAGGEGGSTAGDGRAAGGADADAAGTQRAMGPNPPTSTTSRRQAPPITSVLASTEDYTASDVLSALARRLRLNLLLPPPHSPSHPQESKQGPTVGTPDSGPALLRLVWAAYLADPSGAWRAACVLVGLADELRLVA
ncbi:hypothetical protein GPECTOR_18g89 [Gonium pectorale]|uniref:Uncharacterized protein n=1 Tax=Gonium pectorale TaxID=33097 RepID=A0A150GK18_GONPE|nr:hypothetical protein GPECTOR_18g89 [Gonium pectorale]|eukprot:KXZ50114.1 hypothetical protein GPECTOR_18g89 [Gonium pectorale]